MLCACVQCVTGCKTTVLAIIITVSELDNTITHRTHSYSTLTYVWLGLT